MSLLGKELSSREKEQGKTNTYNIAKVEESLAEALDQRKKAGLPIEKLHKRGEKTAWERIDMLADPDSFIPLNSIYDPEFNQEGTTGLVTGLGRISGRYALIIASDNRICIELDRGKRGFQFMGNDIQKIISHLLKSV